MDGARDGGYMWFDGCRVFSEDMRLLCAVDGHTVPLPVAILHPDCIGGPATPAASACQGSGQSNADSAIPDALPTLRARPGEYRHDGRLGPGDVF